MVLGRTCWELLFAAVLPSRHWLRGGPPLPLTLLPYQSISSLCASPTDCPAPGLTPSTPMKALVSHISLYSTSGVLTIPLCPSVSLAHTMVGISLFPQAV